MEYTKEQLKAAYALNLCTVSVSQIIDYDDTYIMEQEYEAILNNLNLEEMPKDEALLNVLKQILSTITFFRIQEGDKEYIERDYQQRMKNAIWSAIPHIGMIVAGDNLITAGASLASQVGISYMNYRRAKAENLYLMDKSRWELERSAIEQFNTLRRELFTTAWKLSAAYGFADELRLSERQIKQYNDILMDDDPERRYERLDSVRSGFLAYPPFWYFLGNAANAVSMRCTDEKADFYRDEAVKCYEQFLQSFGDKDLLRENPLASACALEYIELIPCETDEEKKRIEELVDYAARMSGDEHDILQFCAVAYIRLGVIDKASALLRRLINEQYNTVLNAQLLSGIYVHNYIGGDKSAESEYRYLMERVDEKYLFPFPVPSLFNDPDREHGEDVLKRFTDNQREILLQKGGFVLNQFRRKYRIAFNKCVPVPGGKEYPDDYYDGSPASDEVRKADGDILRNRKHAAEYASALFDCDYPYNILPVLNDLMNAVTDLNCVRGKENDLLTQLNEAVIAKRGDLLRIRERIDDSTRFFQSTYDEILALTFDEFTKRFFDTLARCAFEYMAPKTDIVAMNEAEGNLTAFCIRQGLPTPEELYRDANEIRRASLLNNQYLGVELIDEGVPSSVIDDRFNTVLETFSRNKDKICPDDSTRILLCGTDEFDRYFINSDIPNKHEVRKKIVAILDDTTSRNKDLLFTTDGIMQVIRGRARSVISYDRINVTPDRKALLLHVIYMNDQINMDSLIDTLSALRKTPFGKAWISQEDILERL